MAERAISEDPRYRARPTVRLGGREVARVSESINAFRIDEREGGLSSLELRLTNLAAERDGGRADHAFEDERDLFLGTELTIYAGDERRPREIFRGVVTSLEVEFPEDGPHELVVLAEDALQKGRMARRTRVHDPLRLARLADDVARTASLTAVVADGFAQLDAGVHVQLNESDLAFLRRVLDRHDGDVQASAGELQVSPRKDVRRGERVTLALGSQLRRARFVVDLAHQVTAVTTAGWDVDAGRRVSARSRGANLGPGGGRTGAELLRDTVGERSEHVGYPPVATAAEARALADAAFDRRARRFVILHGTAQGNPLIRVGAHVQVDGTSRRFRNTYYVVHACHRFDLDRGYETDFEAECAYLGRP